MNHQLESQLANETVLVTGATGFTGGHLARALRGRGATVRTLVRPDSPNRHDLLSTGFEMIVGDLTNRSDVVRAAEGVDRIFHIAATYRSAKHPDGYYRAVNIGGTENVIEAARQCDVRRTIHCSTAGVHGEIHDIPATETSPFNAGDIYQQSKLDGEQCFVDAMRSGMPGVIFRPVGIYGPGDTRFLKLFKTIQQQQFQMFGTGEVLYHMTYIDDLIEGILLCGYHSAAEGETYLLTGPRYTTLNTLVALIAEAVGVDPPSGHLPIGPLTLAAVGCESACRALRIEPPLHRRRIDFFRKDRAFSSEKAKRDLGYEPRIELRDGLARTAEWYIMQGLLHQVGGTRAVHSRA